MPFDYKGNTQDCEEDISLPDALSFVGDTVIFADV